MPYEYNPHVHVKIWLSKNPEVFLNLENQLRLIGMRTTNPVDVIRLVYDSSFLSEQALKELHVFCKKHSITPFDVQEEIIPNCKHDNEKRLIEIYQEEISNLDNGGNLAVASDILRWLKPVYELGTYSDFDIIIDTQKLPQTIAVKESILLNIGSITQSLLFLNFEALLLNNDIIAVVDPEAATPIINKIQASIYEACRQQPSKEPPFSAWMAQTDKNIKEKLGGFRFTVYTQLPTYIQENEVLKTLDTLISANCMSARQLRELIINITQNNATFCRMAQSTSKDFADQLRGELKKQTGWMAWLTTPTNTFNELLGTIALSDDDLITKFRTNRRLQLLKASVTHTTGPQKLMLAMFPASIISYPGEIATNVEPYGFAHYQLENAFKSKQALPFQTGAAKYLQLLSAKPGEVNDLSWLAEGQHAVALREVKIKAAARTIQMFYRNKQTEKQKEAPAEEVKTSEPKQITALKRRAIEAKSSISK